MRKVIKLPMNLVKGLLLAARPSNDAESDYWQSEGLIKTHLQISEQFAMKFGEVKDANVRFERMIIPATETEPVFDVVFKHLDESYDNCDFIFQQGRVKSPFGGDWCEIIIVVIYQTPRGEESKATQVDFSYNIVPSKKLKIP